MQADYVPLLSPVYEITGMWDWHLWQVPQCFLYRALVLWFGTFGDGNCQQN